MLARTVLAKIETRRIRGHGVWLNAISVISVFQNTLLNTMPSDPTTSTNPNSSNCKRTLCLRVKGFGLLGVVVAAMVLAVIYKLQPDFLAPVTMVPCWFWLVALALIICFCIRGNSKWLILASTISTLLFGFLFVDEVRSFTRFRQQEVRTSAGSDAEQSSLRVATLNCNIGSLSCAREVKDLYPDIVVLQESPGMESLTILAAELFGESGQVVSSGDTSILFSGEVVSKNENKDSHYTQVTAQLSSGLPVAVVSARLSPPVYRLDFWNRKFWAKHIASRQDHREQLSEICKSLDTLPSSTPIVVAGDFNSVARDGAFKELSEKFTDAFQVAGLGWGATGTNDFPIFRVDQIWANEHLTPQSVVSRKTKHSDHRMVIGDFEINSR